MEIAAPFSVSTTRDSFDQEQIDATWVRMAILYLQEILVDDNSLSWWVTISWLEYFLKVL